MSLIATPEARGQEWSTPTTPQLFYYQDGHSASSEYSPSVGSVHTAVRLDAGQTRSGTADAMPSFRPRMPMRNEKSPPISPEGGHLSPPLREIRGDQQNWDSPGFEDAEVTEKTLSVYGGPKLAFISPPPWDAELSQNSPALTRPSQTLGPPSELYQTATRTPGGLASPLRSPSPRSAGSEQDVSFLDLAGQGAKGKSKSGGPPKSASSTTIKSKGAAGSNGRSRSPDTPSPPLSRTSGLARSQRPPLPPGLSSSRSLSPSNASDSPTNEFHASLPSTPGSSTGGTPPKPAISGFSLISLEQARNKENDRIKAAAEERGKTSCDEGSLNAPVGGNSRLKNKRSGFLRMFKKPDEENVANMPAMPDDGLVISPGHPAEGRIIPPSLLRPPQSAPANVISFSGVSTVSGPAPRGTFRDKGAAPSLSLRPVSMAISGIPTGFLADPIGQVQFEPPSPCSEDDAPSPAASSGVRSNASELAAVDEQIAVAKAAWQRQIVTLEDQVRALQVEVAALRPRAPAGGFRACDACGCDCAARRQALSVVHRPKQRIEGDGERTNLFANRQF